MGSNEQYFTPDPNSPLDIKKSFESIAGISLVLETASGIFSSDGVDKGTRFLLEHSILPDLSLLSKNSLSILDIGAGNGIISLWLYKKIQEELLYNSQFKTNSQTPLSMKIQQNTNHGNHENYLANLNIYASEINRRAIWLIKRNMQFNQIKNIDLLKGDFVEESKILKEKRIKFHAIYSNPPLKRGHQHMLQIFDSAFGLLHPGGFLLYVHKKKLGAEGFLNKVKKLRPNWNYMILKKVSGYYIIMCSQKEIIRD